MRSFCFSSICFTKTCMSLNSSYVIVFVKYGYMLPVRSLTGVCDENIVQVSVTDAKNVGDNRVAGCKTNNSTST